ncbi:MAG: ATP-binding protein [Gammaproteobacteria bacterium]
MNWGSRTGTFPSKDTGVGIPAEKLPSLFEIFFQVDRSLERSQGGLGIGLSLVRRLVELHASYKTLKVTGAAITVSRAIMSLQACKDASPTIARD